MSLDPGGEKNPPPRACDEIPSRNGMSRGTLNLVCLDIVFN